jgi:hypothetical protein
MPVIFILHLGVIVERCLQTNRTRPAIDGDRVRVARVIAETPGCPVRTTDNRR